MKIFECGKCHSKDVFIDQSGNNIGLYCSDCGKWIKWLNKDERRLAERQIEMSKKGIFGSYNPLPELIFLGMNITGEILKILSNYREKNINGMSDSERKAYDIGISNTLSLLQEILLNSDANYVINTFDNIPTKYTYADLCNKTEE